MNRSESEKLSPVSSSQRGAISDVLTNPESLLFQGFQEALGPKYKGTSAENNALQIDTISGVKPAIEHHGVKVFEDLHGRGLLKKGVSVADIGSGHGGSLTDYLSGLEGSRTYYFSEPSNLYNGEAAEHTPLTENVEKLRGENQVNISNEKALPFLERAERDGSSFDVITFNLVMQNLPADEQLVTLKKAVGRLNPENPDARVIFTLTGPSHAAINFAKIYNQTVDDMGLGDRMTHYVGGMVHNPDGMKNVINQLVGEGACTYKNITDEEMEESGVEAYNRIKQVQPNRLLPDELTDEEKTNFEKEVCSRLVGKKSGKHAHVIAFEIKRV